MLYRILIPTFLIFSLIISPSTAVALQNNQYNERACAQAINDARKKINERYWFAYGLLFGGMGIIAAYVVDVPPPLSAKLAGKPPEYVSTYLKCYSEEMIELRSNKALPGAIINSIIIILFLFLTNKYLLSNIFSLDFSFIY